MYVYLTLMMTSLRKHIQTMYVTATIFAGVCTNSTAPSVSSINRILRNRAAERAAAEFARAAGYAGFAGSSFYPSIPGAPGAPGSPYPTYNPLQGCHNSVFNAKI